MNMSENDHRYLMEEVEKLKFHHRTWSTLIGNICPDGMEKTTIDEAVVLLDLFRSDLRELQDLIVHYDRNQDALVWNEER
ncbi:hypothetical protein [Exiguobacterium sp. S22-S28]|uniref:hypothetical protein n=1 Tax=Exiguobacterium sp. S22-S28 TaxID=3342768 RepID=UPI00372CFE6D